MDKSPEAFRTISEVADTLETPAHVLRFWESRFPQIRPVKRAGGRRYYRPADVALLAGIKRLLHDEGLTIRGVQKILREQGVRHVAGLAGASAVDLGPFDPEAALEEALVQRFGQEAAAPHPASEVETAQVIALEAALGRPAPNDNIVTPDLFQYLADDVESPVVVEAADSPSDMPEALAPKEDNGMVPDTETEAAVLTDELPAAPTTDSDVEATVAPQQPKARVTTSRAAQLRALPRPLPESLQHALAHLQDRMRRHLVTLREATDKTGRKG